MTVGTKIFDGSLVDREPLSFRGLDLPPPSMLDRSSEIPSVRGTIIAQIPHAPLAGDGNQFARPVGPDLLARTGTYYNWQQSRVRTGLWPYERSFETGMGPIARLRSEDGFEAEGINLACQDYLGLTSHPAIHEAVVRSLRDFGPHGAGSPILTGNTRLSRKLEAAIAEFMGMDHIILFPTGWATGFGTITALVREYDYVVMDTLAHASLQQGAAAATRHVVRFRHLDNHSAHRQLRKIRDVDTKNGILVVTEGLYSMDSDSPNIAELQAICREFGATLLVDVAHDLGALGPGGAGQIGVQDMIGKVDLVMGCFSKAFATNGGFLATRHASVEQYVRAYSGSHLFSTAISPIQTGVALESIGIVRSAEGDRLRAALMDVARCIRGEFSGKDVKCLGDPSAIIPVLVGPEDVSRLTAALTFERGVLINLVEYPAVALGASRFRLQAMAVHTLEQARTATRIITECIEAVKATLNLKEK